MEIMNMKIKLMATLWENTYRVAIEDGQQQYLATVRVVVNTPLPEDVLPPNAPQVEPQLLALVEDFNFDANQILSFESTLAALLREKFQYQIQQVFFICHEVVNYEIYKEILRHIEDPKIEIFI